MHSLLTRALRTIGGPPVFLVLRVITDAKMCVTYGTLIVPEWLSSAFWPVLHPTPQQFAVFVVTIWELPLSKSWSLPSLLGCSLFQSNLPNTEVLALEYDFELR